MIMQDYISPQERLTLKTETFIARCLWSGCIIFIIYLIIITTTNISPILITGDV